MPNLSFDGEIIMKICLTTLTAICLVIGANAQIAMDSAEDSVYVVGQEYIQFGTPPGDQTGATNGRNGGFGFNPWQRGGYGDNGNFGSTLVTSVSPSFNMGTKQFGLRAGVNGADFSGCDARRRLLNNVGLDEIVTFSLMPGGNGAGTQSLFGDFGVEFRGAPLANPGRDLFGMNASFGQNYSIQDDSGSRFTGIPVAPGVRVDVIVVSRSTSNFTMTLKPFGGTAETYQLVSYSGANGTPLRTIQFYAYLTNGDSYVNYLKVEKAAVYGNITLLNTAGGSGTESINWVLANGTNSYSGSFTIADTGTQPYRFELPANAANGAYTLKLKGGTFLSKTLNVTLDGYSLNGQNATLKNGDVDQDGEVGPGDFEAVVAQFGLSGDADCDNDGEVGPSDFEIVVGNFGIGDE
jgi:hypothetical protein